MFLIVYLFFDFVPDNLRHEHVGDLLLGLLLGDAAGEVLPVLLLVAHRAYALVEHHCQGGQATALL